MLHNYFGTHYRRMFQLQNWNYETYTWILIFYWQQTNKLSKLGLFADRRSKLKLMKVCPENWEVSPKIRSNLRKRKKNEYYHDIISISFITHEEQNFFCHNVTFLLEQLQNSKSWAHSFISQGYTMFSWISQLTYLTAFTLWFI